MTNAIFGKYNILSGEERKKTAKILKKKLHSRRTYACDYTTLYGRENFTEEFAKNITEAEKLVKARIGNIAKIKCNLDSIMKYEVITEWDEKNNRYKEWINVIDLKYW